MKYSEDCSTSWQWQTLNSLCRGLWAWTTAHKYDITLCNTHLPWMNADLFKQAVISMAFPLFALLLTGMFGYVTGCLISLCLHRVSLRVATLCTAGACLACNVKPGSLWNLTKASTGRGWKFTLIWRLQGLSPWTHWGGSGTPEATFLPVFTQL